MTQPPSEPIASGVRCIQCAYPLNGLPPGGVCPECGRATADSLHQHKLRAHLTKDVAHVNRLSILSGICTGRDISLFIVTATLSDSMIFALIIAAAFEVLLLFPFLLVAVFHYTALVSPDALRQQKLARICWVFMMALPIISFFPCVLFPRQTALVVLASYFLARLIVWLSVLQSAVRISIAVHHPVSAKLFKVTQALTLALFVGLIPAILTKTLDPAPSIHSIQSAASLLSLVSLAGSLFMALSAIVFSLEGKHQEAPP